MRPEKYIITDEHRTHVKEPKVFKSGKEKRREKRRKARARK